LRVQGATATASSAGDRAALTAVDGTVFGYRGLLVRDATGATLPSRLEASGSSLSIRVDDTRARYPVNIDPFVYSTHASMTSSPDFGASVSARRTADLATVQGAYVAVGDPTYNNNDGRAFLYLVADVPANQVPVFGAPTVYASPQAGSKYGSSVDVGAGTFATGVHSYLSTADLIVGVPAFDATYPEQGAVIVQSQLTPTCQPATAGTSPATTTLLFQQGEAGDHLGSAVATDAIGSVVFAGQPDDNYGATVDAGSVLVFVRAGACWGGGTGWQTHGVVNTSPAANDRLGTSVATDRAGTILVAGAPGDDVNGTAQVFQRKMLLDPFGNCYIWGSWSQSSTQPAWHLNPSNPTGSDKFGTDVAISDDAGTVVVGAPNSWWSYGSAYVYLSPGYSASCLTQDWSGGGSSFQAAWLRELSSAVTLGDHTGTSVAVTDNGSDVYVGSPDSEDQACDGLNANEGQVFTFERGSSWSGEKYPTQKVCAGSSTNTPDDHFGRDIDAAQTVGVDKDPLIVGRPDVGGPAGTNYVERHAMQ
jgi:hypothetical protein